jgi:2-dehydro-3-deoxygluconokinase
MVKREGGVAAVGECMLELSAIEGDQWRMGFAGDTLNALWAMRALMPDVHTDYISAFGDDPFSQRQIDFLREYGIGTASSPVIRGARPGMYAITLDGAERSFTYWRNDSAARQLANDPHALAKSLENLKLAYFSGITLAILDDKGRQTLLAALRNARDAGTTIAFDPNYRPRLWQSPEVARQVITETMAVVDIALPTFPDERELFGDATPQATLERLAKAGIGEIVVKNGAEDALVLSESRAIRSAPLTVDDAVDTTGAGDAFSGGYLAARILGHSAEEAARRAHRVAAAVVRVRGALAPFFDTLRNAFDG